MVKKAKVSTPDWILEGYDSKADWEKAQGISSEKKIGKTFKIKECPKCGNRGVKIVLSNLDLEEETNTGKNWQCPKCGWIGEKVLERKLSEDEFIEYLEEFGEENL
jgi:predicted RNA-binding Zn-ribbon protein involved in translation (DUF1610 family)